MDDYRDMNKTELHEIEQKLRKCEQKLNKKKQELKRIKEVIAEFLGEKL